MNKQEMIELLKADVEGWNAWHSDSEESADLSEARLNGANLKGVNLCDARLVNANLVGVNLLSADLKEIDLSNAEMYLANLGGANLSGANLRNSDLSYAHLSGANLTSANLAYADLAFCNFQNVILGSTRLQGVNFWGAKNIVPLYIPEMSSRNDSLYLVRHSKAVMIQAGCFWGNSQEFKAKVLEEKGKGSLYEMIAFPLIDTMAKVWGIE